MNKIRTSLQAQEEIDKEFSWRLKEIADLKSSIKSTKSIRKDTLIRAGIPLLYAHWEGFVKKSSEIYLNYISNQRLSYDELETNFIVHGVKGQVNVLKNSNNVKINIAIIDFLLEELEKRASIPYGNVIDTKSNLNSSVFEDIIYLLGFETSKYEARYNFIDESILKRRNFIAHGEYLDIKYDDYEELSKNVIILLRQFKTDIENSLALEAYKRSA